MSFRFFFEKRIVSEFRPISLFEKSSFSTTFLFLVLFRWTVLGVARRRCPVNPIKSLSKMTNTKTGARPSHETCIGTWSSEWKDYFRFRAELLDLTFTTRMKIRMTSQANTGIEIENSHLYL